MLPEDSNSSERPKWEVGREDEPLKSALSALDKLVLDFVNNPIFEQAKAVNVQMAARARRALEDIIELSNRIRKSSELLKKAPQKVQ